MKRDEEYGYVYGESMSEWRSSRVVALVTISLFIVIQLAIPATRMGDHERAQRFGWQMFSSLVEQVEFEVLIEDSAEPIQIDLREVTARVRDDLSLLEAVPDHLCETVPDAIAVRWQNGIQRC